VLAYGWIGLVLLVTLAPHAGVLLLSFASVWSFSPLPDGWTLGHYQTVFSESAGMIQNTLVYCSIAAGIDVAIGATIAYLMLRTNLPARRWLDWIATRLAGGAPASSSPSATCACSRASRCRAPTSS
jgi:iron(III) transport system permease protein